MLYSTDMQNPKVSGKTWIRRDAEGVPTVTCPKCGMEQIPETEE